MVDKMTEQYEKKEFADWRELAKFVIDGGEVYDCEKEKLEFDFVNSRFVFIFTENLMQNLYIKKQPSLEELLKIKPRLCRVGENILAIYSCKNNVFYDIEGFGFNDAKMLSDEEIKQFLNGDE